MLPLLVSNGVGLVEDDKGLLETARSQEVARPQSHAGVASHVSELQTSIILQPTPLCILREDNVSQPGSDWMIHLSGVSRPQ